MSDELKHLGDPAKIAEAGERIYDEKYRHDLEKTKRGHYIAIDVLSGRAVVRRFPEEALEEARRETPYGVFHLIRIGSAGAFKVSFGAGHDAFWARAHRPVR